MTVHIVFFKCPLFAEQRRALFIGTRSFHPLSAHKVLFGIEGRTDEDEDEDEESLLTSSTFY